MKPSEEYRIINGFAKTAPVNIGGIISALKVQYQEAYLDDDISGMLERVDDDRFRIVVNANHPLTRRRFTAAHELGHYMNHRYLIGSGVDDNKAYRSVSGGKYHNTHIGPAEETEANIFAAGILMPGPLVEREFRSDNHSSLLDRASALAARFEVSEKAMKWRLVNLKLADKDALGL